MSVVETSEQTEKLTEKLRLWQIILGALFGFVSAFTPNLVNYVDKHWLNPPAPTIKCDGKITITYPENKTIIYGDEIDVAGTVNPNEGCKYVFLTVASMDGHQFFTTDAVTVNPDGTWDATAKLYFVPQGTRARIQARLCGKHDDYPPEACLPEIPNKGVASNAIVVSRQAGLPKVETQYSQNKINLKLLEFTPIFVSGQVTGLEKPSNYKIVIYYQDHTFGWVKQPYPGNRKCFSWAPILPNGEWSIALKDRPANKMGFVDKKAVILMFRTETAPDRTKTLENLKFLKKEIRQWN